MTDPEFVRACSTRTAFEVEHDVDPLDVADAYDVLGPPRPPLPVTAAPEYDWRDLPYERPDDPLGARAARDGYACDPRSNSRRARYGRRNDRRARRARRRRRLRDGIPSPMSSVERPPRERCVVCGGLTYREDRDSPARHVDLTEWADSPHDALTQGDLDRLEHPNGD